MATNENLPPNVIKQLVKELKNLDETPPEGIRVVLNDDDFSTIYAGIEGPAGTPYENGIFRMKLLLSHDFPQSPPKGRLIVPFPESALNEQAGKMLLEDYGEYARLARLHTGIHALRPMPKPKTGPISECTTMNVDLMKTIPCTKVPLSSSRLTADVGGKGSGMHNQEVAEVAVGTLTLKQKGVAVAAKAQIEKKKTDARKKSLKRL